MAETQVQYPILAESDVKDDTFVHQKCGSVIMGKAVYHPVWYKGMTAAGGGEVRTETVPYCPACGPVPSSHGAPIYV